MLITASQLAAQLPDHHSRQALKVQLFSSCSRARGPSLLQTIDAAHGGPGLAAGANLIFFLGHKTRFVFLILPLF